MSRIRRYGAMASILFAGFVSLVAAQQQIALPPGVTAEEGRIYQAFMTWYLAQPPDVQNADDDVLYPRYASSLEAAGQTRAQASAAIATIQRVGERMEAERWNRVLTSPSPGFNTAPNAFLVEMIKGLKPGRSLDVGMGQGRNTIYLAQQGWESVGFDPADRAVAAALERAKTLGVKISTTVATEEKFDWGVDAQWDLIVLSYVGGRGLVPRIVKALRPGGMVVVEGFHRDATKSTPIGPAVVFDTNELLQVFSPLRIIRYEDTEAVGDFGLAKTRIVRLAAVKP